MITEWHERCCRKARPPWSRTGPSQDPTIVEARIAMSDDPVVVVVPGDLHLTEPGLENHRVAQWVVDEVNRLIRPDFVQFIGDNVQDAAEAQFRLFDELRGGCRSRITPWWAITTSRTTPSARVPRVCRRDLRLDDTARVPFHPARHAAGPAVGPLARAGGLVPLRSRTRRSPRGSGRWSSSTKLGS